MRQCSCVVVLHVLLPQVFLICLAQKLYVDALHINSPQLELTPLRLQVTLTNISIFAKVLEASDNSNSKREVGDPTLA